MFTCKVTYEEAVILPTICRGCVKINRFLEGIYLILFFFEFREPVIYLKRVGIKNVLFEMNTPSRPGCNFPIYTPLLLRTQILSFVAMSNHSQ